MQCAQLGRSSFLWELGHVVRAKGFQIAPYIPPCLALIALDDMSNFTCEMLGNQLCLADESRYQKTKLKL